MFSFYEAQSKVQKDRQLMRETDVRMAKYSRRGIVTNVLIYLLCLASGEFKEIEYNLSIILTVGLLLTTLLRGYYLYRFESIYPRAPNRWRNIYFSVTLLGAVWWGFITSSMTLALELQYEAPLIWLYTGVFFATTAHAFAPYGRFLTYYQLIGLVPLAISAFFVAELISIVSGVVMLFFCWILNHQSRTMTENYWDRLEANYILARKTETLEEEKRGTRATVQLNQEYMGLLRNELKGLMETRRQPRDQDNSAAEPATGTRPRLLQLFNNVNDFYQILSKELVIHNRVFNLRHLIQNLVAQYVNPAQARNILLDSSLSSTLPMRMNGDVERFSQVVNILLNVIITQSEGCQILLEAEFTRDHEREGELHLTLSRQNLAAKKLFFQDLTEESVHLNLDLALAKGLADALGGSLDLAEGSNAGEGVQLRFRLRMTMAEYEAQMVFQRPQFRGRRILLLHPNPRLLDIKRHELDAMGFVVFTETQLKKAFNKIEEAVTQGQAFDAIVYYLEADDNETIEFAEAILARPDLRFIKQLALISASSLASNSITSLRSASNFHMIMRPAGVFELEIHLQPLISKITPGDVAFISPQVLLYNPDKKQQSHKQWLTQFAVVTEVNTIESLFEYLQAHTVSIIACVIDVLGMSEHMLLQLRNFERERQQEFFTPVVGVGTADQAQNAYRIGVDHFLNRDDAGHTQAHELIYWRDVFIAQQR
ncbi:MAG TPA: sensor histidine kinase [Cellvibrionaceae bacterium]